MIHCSGTGRSNEGAKVMLIFKITILYEDFLVSVAMVFMMLVAVSV